MNMNSGISLRQGIYQTQRLAQSLRLSQEQRILIQGYIFTLRMTLVEELRGEKYEPQATCPTCWRKLTPTEIICGFNQDPNDFTTCCSACGRRFKPVLICFDGGTKIELPFYCDCQTLPMLYGREVFNPEQFARKYPAIYRSAIVHYGGMRRAFEKIGIKYPFKEISDWKNKISPFLGRLPDTIVADCAGVSVATIRKFRRKLGISRYTLHKVLSEII